MKCKIIKIVTTVVALQLSLLLPVGQAYGQTSGRSDADDDVEALRLSSYAVDYQIFWGQNGYFAAPSRDNAYNISGTGSWLGMGENFGGTGSWLGFGDNFGSTGSWLGFGDNFGGSSTWGAFDNGDVPLGGGLLVLVLSGVCYAGAKRVKKIKS